MRRLPALLLVILLSAAAVRAQEPVTLSSPGGNVTATFRIIGDQLHYAVQFGGEDVLQPSPFALTFADAPDFGTRVRIAGAEQRRADATWQRLWGRRTTVRDHFEEVTIQLEELDDPGRRIDFVARAYDDGLAFRYVLPEAWGRFELGTEASAFHFAGEPTVWAVNYGGFHSSQEAPFDRMPMAELSPDSVYGLPLLVQTEAAWAALTEADLTDWGGLYVRRSHGPATGVVSVLSPHPGEPGVSVRSEAPRHSPWRVLMLGDEAGDLIESDLVHNLNDPAEGDFSWVRPGIAAWDRWWSGSWAPDADFDVDMNTATMKYFVDLAAEMGWAYQLVDWYWYGAPFDTTAAEAMTVANPDADITTVVPELDLPELIRYANARGVDILLWLHWKHVDEQMEEAFPLYEDWGAAGIKIDFMDRDDQEMVQFYHRVADLAARHHLMVDFHGAYKPTGVSRTYPNLVTREGVMGAEYNKWSALVTPEHNVTLPFTRGLLGEMDYTPGGFLNKHADEFEVRNEAPFVMGTRAHELAKFVVYESVLQVASDSPYNYRRSPAGLDFLKLVPTTWDDTRVLNGFPGDYVTVARRSGDAWFVASMSDEEARTLELPLGFLDEGAYEATVWMDAPETPDYARALATQTQTVTAADTLTAAMAPGGGYVVRLVPAE